MTAITKERGHRKKIRAAVEALDARGMLRHIFAQSCVTLSCSASW